MKKILLSFSFAFIAFSGFSQTTTTTSGYFKSNGTYVEPHTKTSSNGTNADNFSTQGNRNPFTGSSGTKAPDYSPAAGDYGGNRPVQTGPRGGTYIINSNGNKTYLPKRN